MTKRQAPEECPVCGEPVPRGATACPSCGADERAGWDEEASRLDGIDLPDEGRIGSAEETEATPSWVRPLSIVVLVAFVLGLLLAIR